MKTKIILISLLCASLLDAIVVNVQWVKMLPQDSVILGVENVIFENNKTAKTLIASNTTTLFAVDVDTGEHVYSREFEDPIQHCVKSQEQILIVHGKYSEKVEAINAIDGDLLWEFSSGFKYGSLSVQPPRNHRQMVTNAIFMDVEDRELGLDVLLLSGELVLTRLNGDTGKVIWEWRSDLGNTRFHVVTLAKDLVHLVGTNRNKGSGEICLVGLNVEGKTPVRQSTNFVDVPNDNVNYQNFIDTVNVIGVDVDRFFIWVGKPENDIQVKSFNTGKTVWLSEVATEFDTNGCKRLELINLNSENYRMHEFGVECHLDDKGDKKDWLVQVYSENKNIVGRAAVLAKSESKIHAPEFFVHRDYGEDIFAVARIYMSTEKTMVLELFDLEVEFGAQVFYLEFQLDPFEFEKGETINQSFISIGRDEEKDTMPWNLIIVTTHNRWISFQNDGEVPETQEERPKASFRFKDEL